MVATCLVLLVDPRQRDAARSRPLQLARDLGRVCGIGGGVLRVQRVQAEHARAPGQCRDIGAGVDTCAVLLQAFGGFPAQLCLGSRAHVTGETEIR